MLSASYAERADTDEQDKQLPSSVIRVGNNLYRWQQLGPVPIGSQAAHAVAPANDDSTEGRPPECSLELADLRNSPTGTSPAVAIGVPASPLRGLPSIAWLRDRGAAEVCAGAFGGTRVSYATLHPRRG